MESVASDWRRSVLSVISIPVFIASMALALTGCNTARGVGEDLSAVGDSIEDAASDAAD